MGLDITKEDIEKLGDFERAITLCQKAGMSRLDEVAAFFQVAANEGITAVEAAGVKYAADNKCLRLRYIFKRLSNGVPAKRLPGMKLLRVDEDAKNLGTGAPHDTYYLSAKGARTLIKIVRKS